MCSATGAYASITAANQGFTGTWEYPSAEMPGDGAGRAGYTRSLPYAYYYVDMAWLPWLEINGRITTFDNIYVVVNGKVERDYMDKAVDVKVMLHRSRDWRFPSLAVGGTDVKGTELFRSWYGVATWRRDNLAFSLGYGTDRMNGVFAGASWNVADWLTLKAEYSPMDYTNDGAGQPGSRRKTHPDPADSKLNLGAVLSAPWGTDLSLSWQRGEEFVVSLNQEFDMTRPLFSRGKNRVYDAPGSERVAQWRDVVPEKLAGNIVEALSRFVKARDVEVGMTEGKIYVAYENFGHGSQAETMVRVLVVMAALSPHLDSVYLIPRVRGVPVVCAEFPGDLLFALRARDLGTKDLLGSAEFTWAERDFFEARGLEQEWVFHGGRDIRDIGRHDAGIRVSYEPRVDQTLDDDYQNRWSLYLSYEDNAYNGWGAYAGIRFPIYNDVDIWWEPDMNDEIRIQRAVINYLGNFRGNRLSPLWTLSEAGWLDQNWFGFNQWGRVYTGDGRLWAGVRLGIAHSRDPMSFAGLSDGQWGEIFREHGVYLGTDAESWRTVGWLQGGFSLTEMGLDFQLDAGRFLDGDEGVTASVVRRWDYASIGFWAARTNHRLGDDKVNNAGVHVELPLETWFGGMFGNSTLPPSLGHDISVVSSWRFDAAREPGAWMDPGGLLSQFRPAELKKNVGMILEEYCAFEDTGREKNEILGLTDFLKKVNR